MRFAVVGNTGMFGKDMESLLKKENHDVRGFNRSNLFTTASVPELVKLLNGFDVVVNAVAYTAVDDAENNFDLANSVNGNFAGLLAQACKFTGARFIQVSTDYVFDGLSNSPYKIHESINPKTAYGRSKALGERLVQESGDDYSIIRTAWLYGAYGQCFPRVVAELLKTNGTIRVVGDQVGQPTWTKDLANVILQVVNLVKMPRIVHAVSSGQASWADFAKEVANAIGISDKVVEEISSAEHPTPAKRPEWSVLDNSSDFLIPIGDWRERWHVAAPEVLEGI